MKESAVISRLKEHASLYYKAASIPISCFFENSLLFQYSHPLQDYNLPLLLFSSVNRPLPPVWYSFTPELLYFGGIQAAPGYTVFFGPVIASACSQRQAEDVCRQIGRRAEDVFSLRRYLNASGQHTLPGLLANLTVFCRMLSLPVPAPVPMADFSWHLPYKVPFSRPFFVQQEYYPDIEAFVLSCIRTGKPDVLSHYLTTRIQELPFEGNLSTRRSYLLGSNMLASRAAYDAGVDYHTINDIAGKYIDLILQAKTISDLDRLFIEFFREYATLVAQLFDLPSDSPIVRFIHRYISTHYHEKITPHSLAEQLHMNVSYLCTHFKKETGQTVSAYVQQEKIREAERLLTGTRDNVAQISAALGFSSQSYFCAVFKKITGRTPESCRLSHR